jgi:hypothetical protein
MSNQELPTRPECESISNGAGLVGANKRYSRTVHISEVLADWLNMPQAQLEAEIAKGTPGALTEAATRQWCVEHGYSRHEVEHRLNELIDRRVL